MSDATDREEALHFVRQVTPEFLAHLRSRADLDTLLSLHDTAKKLYQALRKNHRSLALRIRLCALMTEFLAVYRDKASVQAPQVVVGMKHSLQALR